MYDTQCSFWVKRIVMSLLIMLYQNYLLSLFISIMWCNKDYLLQHFMSHNSTFLLIIIIMIWRSLEIQYNPTKLDNTVINGNSAFRFYYKICRSKKRNLEKVTKRIKFLQTSAVHCYETEWLSEPVLILEVIFYHIQVNFYYNDPWSCNIVLYTIVSE